MAPELPSAERQEMTLERVDAIMRNLGNSWPSPWDTVDLANALRDAWSRLATAEVARDEALRVVEAARRLVVAVRMHNVMAREAGIIRGHDEGRWPEEAAVATALAALDAGAAPAGTER